MAVFLITVTVLDCTAEVHKTSVELSAPNHETVRVAGEPPRLRKAARVCPSRLTSPVRGLPGIAGSASQIDHCVPPVL